MVLAGCGDDVAVCAPSDAPQFRISAEVPAGSFGSAPVALALEGTRRLNVAEVRPGPGGRTIESPPDHRLHVRALDPGIEIAEVEPALVTVAGRAVGTSRLEVLDCDGAVLVPGFDVNVVAADRIALWPYDGFDRPPVGADVAFAVGTDKIGVALFSPGAQPTRLVDSSMQITAAGGAPLSSEQRSWEQLYVPDARSGVYDVEVTAAGMHVTLPLVITDHADALEAIDPPATIAPATSVTLCFSPKLGGRHVTGFSWTFVIDRVEDPGHGPINCRAVSTAKTSGTLVVTASAGGQSTTVTLTVQP
jgi:hypothetical protein